MSTTKDVPYQVRARLALRASGAAGEHGDRRLKRLRDRGSQKRFALNDQWNGYEAR